MFGVSQMFFLSGIKSSAKTAAKGSRIANHAWSNKRHAIDFENASILTKALLEPEKH